MNCIEINHLSFSFGEKHVLQNISFSVPKGKTLVILGLNGSGKSTLINCIMGFLKIGKNKIKVFGNDVEEMTYKERAAHLSFVAQDVENCSLTVSEYLTLGRIVHKPLWGFVSPREIENITDLAKEMDVSHLLDKQMDEISGGEKQMVAITRALIQDSPIIVFDEPTSSLDYCNQIRFLKTVKRLNEKGKTVIFSTHNPNHALAIDSMVCVLSNMRINTLGDAKAVVNSDMISELYGNEVCFIDYNGVNCCAFKIE